MSSNHPPILDSIGDVINDAGDVIIREEGGYLGTSHSRMILEIANGPLQMLSTFEAEHLTILVVTPCV